MQTVQKLFLTQQQHFSANVLQMFVIHSLKMLFLVHFLDFVAGSILRVDFLVLLDIVRCF